MFPFKEHHITRPSQEAFVRSSIPFKTIFKITKNLYRLNFFGEVDGSKVN
jgi:hypothetical protein